MFQENISFDELGPVKLSKMLKEGKNLRESVINNILHHLKNILLCEPNVYYLKSPLIVCGDIHGQLFDLFKLFEKSGDDFINALSEPTKLNNTYLFLGNYVDRGHNSIGTFIFLSILKIKFPHQIFLIRGDSENGHGSGFSYGLLDECVKIYGHQGLFLYINDIFQFLPLAAVIDNKIFCVHGGLSPKINYIGQISTIYRKKEAELNLIEDLLYSIPENVPKFIVNRKYCGYYFGKNETLSFLYNNGLIKRSDKLVNDITKDHKRGFIIRSYECQKEGFKWWHDNNLVSIFSAPNYMKKCNKAVFMKISDTHEYDFVEFYQDKSYINLDNSIIEYFA